MDYSGLKHEQVIQNKITLTAVVIPDFDIVPFLSDVLFLGLTRVKEVPCPMISLVSVSTAISCTPLCPSLPALKVCTIASCAWCSGPARFLWRGKGIAQPILVIPKATGFPAFSIKLAKGTATRIAFYTNKPSLNHPSFHLP